MTMSKEDVKQLRDNTEIAVTNCSVKANDDKRDELSADVERFLAKNGNIEVIPYLVAKDSPEPAKGKDSIGRDKGEWHKGAKRYAEAAKEKNGQLERKKSGWRKIQDKRSASADEQGNW